MVGAVEAGENFGPKPVMLSDEDNGLVPVDRAIGDLVADLSREFGEDATIDDVIQDVRHSYVLLFMASLSGVLERLWEDIEEITVGIEEPWLLFGDFNSILSHDEGRGGADLRDTGCSCFKIFVFNDALNYLGFESPKYTWRRISLHQRLDKVLCNDRWKMDVPYTTVAREPGFKSWLLQGGVLCNCEVIPNLRRFGAARDSVVATLPQIGHFRSDKLIWKIATPQRVKIFLWLLIHGRLLTKEEHAR
ncbi:hypothetical protein F383_21111 [Gossypium arboreum]|uniref:Endonuclease/exonuclease/phosphatase domain-containing protein n=1 Tax=Gossypium arboreum TaxID=29729 RepID=A0A0B0P0F9_GOSAR|nr:hypothetical protein F383_21111 [Gossypium arboreum]